MTAEQQQHPRTHLLSLPPEIREEIYRIILNPAANKVDCENEYSEYKYQKALVLFKINRQIYVESRKIFRDLNVFVRIETPWPEAQNHVNTEGHVPILFNKEKAAAFNDHSLNINIDAPEHSSSYEWDIQRFVILLDDLDKFTKMWFYADLTHPGLNEHLRLKLSLRDPHAPAWEEKRMSKGVQRKMLLPFGDVKNLHSTIVTGEPQPLPSIEEEMRKLQAEPHLTPEHCLREATRLKLEGNAELMGGNYEAALEIYREAWRAMHVVVKGRRRHIHADAFFGRELREEPFKGKNGASERLMLRVQLVANTCQAYLKLEQYEECRFWGNRTISMLREAMGADPREILAPEDEAFLSFPATRPMGKIYYRTAVANKELGEEGEARRLLKVAQIYLPQDKNVKKEIAATALKLG